MNLSEMIEFVRRQADTDADDAPTSTLTVYARAAYNDIRRRILPFIDLRTNRTLTSVIGQEAYSLSGPEFGGTTDLEFVSAIVGPTDILDWVSFDDYLLLKDADSVSYSTAEATHYAVRAGQVFLYPSPSAVKEYTVYGYREFADWPSGSDQPDLPREFDEVICWFMLSRYFASQEDLELMQSYERMYETAVGRFLASQMRNDAHSPKIFGGKLRRAPMSYDRWVRRQVEG